MTTLILALLALMPLSKPSPVDTCTNDLYAVAKRFVPDDSWQAPTHRETVPAMRQRHRAIARSICNAVNSQPAIEGFTKTQTSRVTMAMAIGESNLTKDADVGLQCYRKHPYESRCDGGLAVGVLQVQLAASQRAHYFRHRDQLVKRALRGLRYSFSACRSSPLSERLAAYASGSCTSDAGRAASRRRWKLVSRVLVWVPPKVPES